MAIEIVDFPIKNGWIFHSYVNVYQRVYAYVYSDEQLLRMYFGKHVLFIRAGRKF